MPVSTIPIRVPRPLFPRAGAAKVVSMPEASMLELSRREKSPGTV